jgi:hypothetical protein
MSFGELIFELLDLVFHFSLNGGDFLVGLLERFSLFGKSQMSSSFFFLFFFFFDFFFPFFNG